MFCYFFIYLLFKSLLYDLIKRQLNSLDVVLIIIITILLLGLVSLGLSFIHKNEIREKALDGISDYLYEGVITISGDEDDYADKEICFDGRKIIMRVYSDNFEWRLFKNGDWLARIYMNETIWSDGNKSDAEIVRIDIWREPN